MTTRDRLLDATLVVLCDQGYRGAATRQIATQAGLSEMTLFRHFPTKNDLVQAALERATEPFRRGATATSDDVEGDLVELTAGYVEFIDRWPALVDRVLPEIASDEELRPVALELMERNAAGAAALIAHHQAAGRLAEAELSDLVRALLGPLLARAALRHVLPVEPFEPRSHVRHFLDGHRPTTA